MGQYYKAVLKDRKCRTWKSYNPTGSMKLTEHGYVNDYFVNYIKYLIFDLPTRVVWAGDYADNEKGKEDNLYFLAKRQKPNHKEALAFVQDARPRMKYLVNESKRLYVDYSKTKEGEDGDIYDPLPLLCAEGNGRGGGDYRGKNPDAIGTWARDFIYVTNKVPDGYKEIEPFVNA